MVGINNVFNAVPPLLYTGSNANSDAKTYDYKGRYFFARMSHKF